MSKPLKEITKKIASGATPSGGKESYKDFGISLIRSQNILDFDFDYNGLAFIDEDQAQKLKNVIVEKNDILLNITGDSVARCSIVPEQVLPARVNQHVMIIRVDDKQANYKYVFYYLQYIKRYLLQLASGGATRNALTKTMIENLEYNHRSIEEQEAIANILSSLDDKIEINNAIIANLEEQAKTIFKSWFMDSALFQDEEFETKKLGELFEFIKGKKPKTISEVKKEGFVPYLVKKYIDGDEATFTSSDDGILIDDLDIFMLMDGANSGNIYYGYHGILGSTFSFLKNVNEMVNEYIYWYLLINQESVKNQNTGSAIPHANKDYINNLEVALPIDIETNKVLKRLKDIRLYTINIRRENNKLSESRDTLLPKLMSGELRVEDTVEAE
ncbi:restriction endonuclease subunit S [Aerococcus urinaeequi]|uniref:restriction endonuclease subunit S n=1 Tax=Aerococcus urinaeequi TaxID=51665 RepID=UPI0004141F3F|nr:restriction endonuclease subunit S [Aerococcus urinaeequi]